VREERDGGGVCSHVSLAQVNVVIVGFAGDWNCCLETVVNQGELFVVLSSLVGFEVKDELLNLVDFKDALTLLDGEAWRAYNLPLSLLFADVANHDRFLSVVLHGDKTVLNGVGEVQDGTATHGSDGDDELFTFSDHDKIVGIVTLGLGREFNNISNLHSWCDLA